MSAAEGGVWRDATADDGGGLAHVHPQPPRRKHRKRSTKPRVQPAESQPAGSAGCKPTPLGPDRKRPRTVSVRRISVRASARVALEYPEQPGVDYQRPATRADCLPGGANAQRPCPFVSCKHHLALEVNARNGNIKMNFPDVEVWEMRETCALDVADYDGATLIDVGRILNLTRERIRQIQDVALFDLAGGDLTRELADIEHTDSRGEFAASDDGSGARTEREALSGLWSSRTAGVSLW